MNRKAEEIEKTIAADAARLLARAVDTYSLSAETLAPRICAVVEKYLLRDDANASPADVSEFAAKLHADDLCLIVACEQGNETAWTDLVARFGMTVRSAARSVSSNEEGAEDLAQSIWAELHGLRIRDDGKPASKLAYYSGRGSLAGWLRAVVGQLAVDQHRKQSRLVQTEDDSEFDRLIQKDEQYWSGHADRMNPETEISDKRASADLQKALADSIGHLSDEDRLLVKLYYFDGLKLHEAGAILGVHEATASRRLTRIHADLRLNVAESLKNEHGWTRPETERAFSDIALQLEADIEPMLMGETMVENEREMTG
ncbi:MAG TPA: sigma-70 family RNA polymerase sigma factor [Pyrinomonadaceae bacterium]|nr:sigma-70 family RNA polymerase sigma factor [Pyrinomonadaceae bacterium]